MASILLTINGEIEKNNNMPTNIIIRNLNLNLISFMKKNKENAKIENIAYKFI